LLSHRPVATQQDSSLCIYAATSPDPTRHNHTRKATLTRCERQLFIANICRGRCCRSTGATGQGPTTVNHVLIEEHGCTVSHTACCTQTERRQVAPLRMPSASEKVAFYPKTGAPKCQFPRLRHSPTSPPTVLRVLESGRPATREHPVSPNIILQTSFPLASPPPLAALLPPSRGNRPSHQKGL
jgi:hypothetical protein